MMMVNVSGAFGQKGLEVLVVGFNQHSRPTVILFQCQRVRYVLAVVGADLSDRLVEDSIRTTVL